MKWFVQGLCTVALGVVSLSPLQAQDLPPLEKVTEGYTEVTGADGAETFYKVWVDKKNNQVLCGLPKNYAKQKHFIALTVSSGQVFAGLQGDDYYVYWRKIGNRLALIKVNTEIRSEGDQESKRSVARLFTDEVMLDVPIVAMQSNGSPVIDMDAILVGQASEFFGPSVRLNSRLASVSKAKAFPENIELAFEAPSTSGRLQTLHYSFSLVPDKASPSYGYKPRLADERVGYFTTSYDDFGKYDTDETRVRFINRWRLEKKDPSLKLSPPKKPIVFYIENTTPVRYRKWIRQGVNYWNKAFEEIGFDQAIIVHDQDSNTLYQSYDPEDVRYNFIRWLNNDISTAIGPSRVHPETGEILDADIVLTDGWIRAFQMQYQKQMPKIAMDGMNAETLMWLAENPDWDPRVRLAPPAMRDHIRRSIQTIAQNPESVAGTQLQTRLLGDEPMDGLVGRTSQVNGYCMAADGKTMDIAFMRMAMAMQEAEAKKDEEKKDEGEEAKKEEKPSMLDGMPEEFIGPLVADLVCHEVGHTLGLRHNFKGSSIHTMDQINSDEVKGKKTVSGSVMDYIPTNFRFTTGAIQGDYGMIGIGPYDFWAIEYGYTTDKKLEDVLKRVAEPELVYATDEDTGGPDPLARRYDFGKDPLAFAEEQIALVEHHRGRILEDYVKDGESWAKSRDAYELTLSMQMRASSMMANWVGGSFVYRDRKGDPNGRLPLEAVPAEQQRKALEFVIANSFQDKAFGLTPDLLSRMTVDKWLDLGMQMMGTSGEPTWPLHDRIMGLQAVTLTQLMNPTTLRRVYDNEARVAADQECFTLPEFLDTVGKSIWTELEQGPAEKTTARKPAISSLRRNLQAEHVGRLLTLANSHTSSVAALRPIATLAKQELRDLNTQIAGYLEANADNLDPYSTAHLNDVKDRITRYLDAQYIAQ